ncbi:hypothetical protein LIER_22341 [Lithospermum erythrorhizon]|uniref:Reverse transcriptase RNase H-like domain-containing protein n=1 Tax=Lithospermum erythrorhizon TaxID=34254 RepID=A0AAV3QVV4_LITER
MKPPSSYKDIQKLTRCLAALSQFISKSGERNLPVFKNLRKLLSRPKEGDELQLYLAVAKGAISSVRVREMEGVQKPIYYVNHVLHGSEENYLIIDKFAFALVVSACRLKPYFESHPITVVTDQPLKRILTNPALSGRMTTWAVKLSDFIHHKHWPILSSSVQPASR